MAEQPKYKLYYFNLYALGEPLRVLFAYGRIKYEDVRIERSQWPALKPSKWTNPMIFIKIVYKSFNLSLVCLCIAMPLGQMPVLEIDNDKRVYQSMAIARYLAKIVGLSGANDWEDLLIDVVVDTIKDYELSEQIICVQIHLPPRIWAFLTFSFNFLDFLFLEIADAEFDKDENAKQKKYAHCKKEVIPFYMAKLDAIAKENNGYMALGRVCFNGIYF